MDPSALHHAITERLAFPYLAVRVEAAPADLVFRKGRTYWIVSIHVEDAGDEKLVLTFDVANDVPLELAAAKLADEANAAYARRHASV